MKLKKPYYVWRVGDKELKLRLTNKNVFDLEERYGGNLLSLLSDMPTLTVMLDIITKATERFEHGITRESVDEFYEKYIDNGGSQIELFTEVLLGIFGVSGFFSQKMKTDMNSKMTELKNNI